VSGPQKRGASKMRFSARRAPALRRSCTGASARWAEPGPAPPATSFLR
jgi:hypothetical protein